MKWKLFSIAVVAALFAAAWNQQAIADWWVLRDYTPDAEIVALAEASYLSDYGKRLFYVSDPQINDKESFNKNCPIYEKSHVLGCYSQRRIYVLRVDRPELDGIMEVTAAHEMLHAAYDRLGSRERTAIVELLELAYAEIDDDSLRSLIRSYEETGGVSVRQNELHSILPTQVVDLPQELEEYYDQYFTDRRAVATLYRSYEAVFEELHNQIDRLKDEIAFVRGQLNELEQRINGARAQVNSLNRELRRLEREEDVGAYNRLVPAQNAAVERYNGLVDQYLERQNRHNSLVEEVNRSVLLQNELVNSLDSSFEPL